MSEATIPPESQASASAGTEKKKLYVSFAPDGTAQIESDLDFPRDALLQRLAAKGLRLRIVDQFVCP